MPQAGPGRAHRTGVSLIELFDMFPTEEAARTWFEDIRWPGGKRPCPRCQSADTYEVKNHNPQPYRCRSCWKFFSVKVGTAMEASNLPLRKWVIGYYLMTTNLKGVSSMKLHRDLRITQKSAWHMGHRIRTAWEVGGGLLGGEVEIDETYIGGKRKYMHKDRRAKLTGRGTAGKAIVIGAKQRDSGAVRARVIADTKGRTLKGFVGGTVTPGSTVYTDEHVGYRGLPRVTHQSVRHGVGQYVDNQAHVNGLESFWSLLKRGYHGVYHKMSRKHLGRYVTEFSGRASARDMDTLNQMALLVRGTLGKRLMYRDLIAD